MALRFGFRRPTHRIATTSRSASPRMFSLRIVKAVNVPDSRWCTGQDGGPAPRCSVQVTVAGRCVFPFWLCPRRKMRTIQPNAIHPTSDAVIKSCYIVTTGDRGGNMEKQFRVKMKLRALVLDRNEGSCRSHRLGGARNPSRSNVSRCRPRCVGSFRHRSNWERS